ncbi:DUF3147 family protein [Bacillus sp. JJ722]|uniref:DUF3147 family protein n=1 Tax=Bacillus sp. JJ722 TaxID=3122973 RepID=UPI002FFEF0E5
MNKDLVIRFLLGGTAVMLSYLITVISPWKLLAGIFASFPAVMITAVLMVGIKSGSKKAACIAKGSVYGMIGCLMCVVTVFAILEAGGSFAVSVIVGLVIWLVSSVGISFIKLNRKNVAVTAHKK